MRPTPPSTRVVVRRERPDVFRQFQGQAAAQPGLLEVRWNRRRKDRRRLARPVRLERRRRERRHRPPDTWNTPGFIVVPQPGLRARGAEHARRGRSDPRRAARLRAASPDKRALVVFATGRAAVRRQWMAPLGPTYQVRDVAAWPALGPVLAELRPGTLLLDAALCPSGASDLAAAVRRFSVLTNVILFADRPTEAQEMTMLRAGVRGYCPMTIARKFLPRMVSRVQDGEIWIGRKSIARLLAELTARTDRPAKRSGQRPERDSPASLDPLAGLTPLKREIANLVARGASNKEIAHQLRLAEKTVKAHLTAIFRRIGVTGRVHLALLVNSAQVRSEQR